MKCSVENMILVLWDLGQGCRVSQRQSLENVASIG